MLRSRARIALPVLGVALVCTGWLGAGPVPCARADEGDVFGFGSEAVARAGAMAAVSTDSAAVFYNPAGLAFARRPTLSLGVRYASSSLSIATATSRTHVALLEPVSLQLGVSYPIGRFLALGLGVSSLPTTFIRFVAHPANAPIFPAFDGRSDRLSVMPAFAFRPVRSVAFGFGLDVFAGLSGLADAAEGPSGGTEGTVVQEFSARAAVHAGARFDAGHGLTLALAYRQAFHVPLAERISTNISGLALTGAVSARALETPHELVLGLAFRRRVLELSLDTTLSLWGLVPAPSPIVDARVSGVAIASARSSSPYHDVVSVRASLAIDHDLSARVRLVYRIGGSIEPSFVGAQTGATNLLDGPKVGLGLGLGVVLRDVGRLDLHAQAIAVSSRRFDKATPDPSNPGFPFIAGGGVVYTAGATFTFEVSP